MYFKAQIMKNSYSIFFQAVLSVLLISSFAFAAPTITIDGSMGVSEWIEGSGSSLVYYEDGDIDGTDGFFVEQISLYIDDTNLYFGLRTGFDITEDNMITDDGRDYVGGDFALNFIKDGADDTFEFGFRYNITADGTSTIDLYSVASWQDPVDFPASTPWRMDSSTPLASSIFAKSGTSPDSDDDIHYTLEATVSLDILTDELEQIYTDGYSFNGVKAHWTMECGNDLLETTMVKQFDYSPTPEPATLLLFGMGLLGAGAYGRKRQKNSLS